MTLEVATPLIDPGLLARLGQVDEDLYDRVLALESMAAGLDAALAALAVGLTEQARVLEVRIALPAHRVFDGVGDVVAALVRLRLWLAAWEGARCELLEATGPVADFAATAAARIAVAARERHGHGLIAGDWLRRLISGQSDSVLSRS